MLTRGGTAVAVGLSIAMLTMAEPGLAQSDDGARIVPTNNTVITGYGTVGFAYQTQGDNANAFMAAISPIFLFQFQDRVLFEAEFEFELQEGVTETGLEYAQLDFIAHNNVTLVGGKFLLPFGVFGPRLHPTWINKFPTHPPIYGHDETGFGVAPLLSVLSDVGVMARGVITPGEFSLALNGYVTQGPALEEEEMVPAGAQEEFPEFHFPASSGDNNKNKMIGGRFDAALPPWGELNLSALHGAYDPEGRLNLTAWNVAAEGHARGFEIRGEYMQTRQEVETAEGVPTLKRDGFYAQAAYRYGRWEPVIRWTQIFDTKLNGDVEEQGAWQAGFGLDYWFSPSVAVMAGYELNREDGPEIDNDRVVAHVAFGF